MSASNKSLFTGIEILGAKVSFAHGNRRVADIINRAAHRAAGKRQAITPLPAGRADSYGIIIVI